ncbi:MAG TPA: DUF1801 domain-containing protein [Polyangiaceae bacterium]|jgi:hypothetical protein|nr:DUF1801 domain-containing protein [Polyangiaceae bacterium]
MKKKKTARKAKKKAPPAKQAAARTTKKAGKKRAAAKPGKKVAARPAPRADLGAPVDGFFLKQPPALRAILDELRQLVEQEVPRAEAAIKWGNPFYTLDGKTLCALSAHKSHVNLILAGPPGSFDDPHGRLTGEGKTGRHLKLTSAEQIPHDEVRGWLRKAAAIAAG